MVQKLAPIQEEKIFSKELNEEIDLMIYLPTTFSPLYKYNLLIAQDGADYFKLGKIARFTEELLSKGEIENVIIIGIPYKDVADRRKKYHPEGEQFDAYIRFLAHELVPYLDEKFPSYQMGHGRALIGDSLGATVSLMAALSYPHTFGRVMMQSPFVNETVLNAVKDFASPALLSIYHQIGKEETEVETTDGQVKDFVTPNRALHEAMKEKGYPVTYEEFDGNHTWTYWQPLLKDILKKMM
ncbi:alpha/beta hydrolase [Bacillus kexueae]|uniref:alpha/beta hydrolase n=1 Tax=Aeribacillus kexueae TaxID=2078952 RepID=UPI001FAF445A|nr:esterase family protein [Bacillus kexueae]